MSLKCKNIALSRHGESTLLLAAIVLFSLWCHFAHFENFNFAGDQGAASWRAWEIWQNREITLVGIPITSWEYQGLQAHISSLAYYLQIVFLLAGRWQPVQASTIFTLAAIAAGVILYLGLCQLLENSTSALAITGIYLLFPLYIDYTRFLWNPNFQLLLLPLSIFCLAQTKRHRGWLIATGVIWGLMACLHYQFILALLGACLFCFWKRPRSEQWRLTLGLGIGLLPVLALELHTRFYNTRILWQILLHSGDHHAQLPAYYFMVSGLLFLIFIFWNCKIIVSRRVLYALTMMLFITDACLYLPSPRSMWHCSADHWFYALEEKANAIIGEQNLSNFNFVNLVYADPLANVQKYLLATKNSSLYSHLSANYYDNQYLFILAPHNLDLSQSINYEVNTFVPEATASWSLSDDYDLILWSRL